MSFVLKMIKVEFTQGANMRKEVARYLDNSMVVLIRCCMIPDNKYLFKVSCVL